MARIIARSKKTLEEIANESKLLMNLHNTCRELQITPKSDKEATLKLLVALCDLSLTETVEKLKIIIREVDDQYTRCMSYALLARILQTFDSYQGSIRQEIERLAQRLPNNIHNIKEALESLAIATEEEPESAGLRQALGNFEMDLSVMSFARDQRLYSSEDLERARQEAYEDGYEMGKKRGSEKSTAFDDRHLDL